MRELAEIQRRFYELVTAGQGAIDPGLLGTTRHLDVYAEMYVARLHDVLATDYPKLRATLGEDAFLAVATAYVRARPPTSYSVRDAGLALSEYLRTHEDAPPWSADLAALERARVEVFDAADAATLSRDMLASVPIERFPEQALALVPASVLVPVEWTVDDLWSAIEDGAAHELPARCERSVLVWRRDLEVIHRTLDHDEVAVAPLLAAGTTIAALSARLGERSELDDPAVRLVELLARWLDAGVIVG